MGEMLTACAGCGVAMKPAQVTYDREARPLCDACVRKLDLIETNQRAAANIQRAGYACAIAGIAAPLAPVFHYGLLVACGVVALTSGVFALQSLARGNERFTRLLTPLQLQLVWVTTVGGMLLVAVAALGGHLGKLIP